MPRKAQGWITFQASEEEQQLLEQICEQTQRTKTEVLRELLRGLQPVQPATENSAPAQFASEELISSPVSTPRKRLKVSSRNVLQGAVKRIVPGTVNSEVVLEVASPVELVSIITCTSVAELGLSEGKAAYAVIKSSDVVIAID